MPLVLMKAVDGPLTDTLNIVLHYIQALPPELQSEYERHVDTHNIESLQLMCEGLNKLRLNILPTEDELDAISHPHDVFRELGDQLRSAASSARIPFKMEMFVDGSIADQLDRVGEEFLPDPDFAIVQWWFESLQNDPNGPFSSPPPLPSP